MGRKKNFLYVKCNIRSVRKIPFKFRSNGGRLHEFLLLVSILRQQINHQTPPVRIKPCPIIFIASKLYLDHGKILGFGLEVMEAAFLIFGGLGFVNLEIK